MVGTSWSNDERIDPVTPSARSFPALICCSIDGSALNMYCTLPANKSVTPGALPL